MAQKRISRARKRDLEKPDEFLTLTSRVLEKIKTNWKPISLGCAVLLAILAGRRTLFAETDQVSGRPEGSQNQDLQCGVNGLGQSGRRQPCLNAMG